MKTEQEIKDKYEEVATIVKDGISEKFLCTEALGVCDALLWVQGKSESMLGSLILSIKNLENKGGNKMSADNGIYILQTNKADGFGFEYRVAECQAVENINYYNPTRGYNDKIADDAMLVIYFGGCTVEENEIMARAEACAIEDDILQSEWPILEYGISTIKIDKVFPSMSLEEADEIEHKRWADKVIN